MNLWPLEGFRLGMAHTCDQSKSNAFALGPAQL